MHCHGNKLKMDFPIHPFLIPLFRSPKLNLFNLVIWYSSWGRGFRIHRLLKPVLARGPVAIILYTMC